MALFYTKCSLDSRVIRKNYAFTPSSTVILPRSTTYWVVAEGVVRWVLGGTGEDATPAMGWSIANNYEFRVANSTGSFTTDPAAEVLQIRVNGTLGGIVLSTDATLSALALEDASDDSAITISPAFGSGTKSYTADVDNGVDEITITPTVNESNATVEYLDSTDTAITDADSGKTGQQVSLAVGANTIKVKVTAEDATTTNTYTVVVTRARTPPTSANQSVVTIEDSDYTFSSDDFSFDDTDGDSFVSVKIVTLPASDTGTLSLSDTAIGPGNLPQTVPEDDLDELKYSPPANLYGTDFASFTFKVNDGTDDSDSAYTMTIAVLSRNDPATGEPTISGTAREGQTLTVSTVGIMDVDGLPSTFSYRWLRLDSDANFVGVISGEMASTYTLTTADVGNKVLVEVYFTDVLGGVEVRQSAAYPATGVVTAVVVATAQSQMVPANWALKPTDIGVGEQFRLMFATSTFRNARSTNIADYNTFVRTSAAAGLTALQTYAADFTALVSTESVNARANTLTWATDTDAPVYWVRSGVDATHRAADDYADFFDGSWATSWRGFNESGVAISTTRFWTGTNTDGTTHATQFMGPTGGTALTAHWVLGTPDIEIGSTSSATTSRIVALSPVFQVANTAPTVATVIPDRTATVGTALLYAFPANTFADTDTGDTLTYTATQSDDSALPAWLSFTAATRTFSGTPQTADVGTVSVEVTASDGTDSVSDTFDIVVSPPADTTAPTVASIVRQTPTSSPTNADSLTWRVTFSEAVSNVDAADFAVSGTNATRSVSAVSGVTGAYDVTASGGSLAGLTATVTLSIASGHNIQDAASNALTNTTPTGTNDDTWMVDNTAPTVTITGVPPTSTAAFTATFTFSEDVTGFVAGDITVGNGTASAFTATTADRVYTASITPTANGAVTVDVAADAATDEAGNGNPAATRATSTYTAPLVDNTAPTVASIVRQTPTSSPTNADSLTWRVTFSEAVSNVDAADFAVSGTTATVSVSAVSGVTGAYDVTASGGNLAGVTATVTLAIAAGHGIQDAATNALTNTTPTGANDDTWMVDNTAPTVAITGVPGMSTAPFTATFTFSEDVTGFTMDDDFAEDDIEVGNGAASAFTATTAGTVFTALITPAAAGTVTVDVAADAATDEAGNGSTAAAQATSIYTVTDPCATSVTDQVWCGAVTMNTDVSDTKGFPDYHSS